MWLVVGLGNTGERYQATRHNVAWVLFDEFLDKTIWEHDKYAHSELISSETATIPVVYVKPQTMMNNSGEAVAYLAKQHSIEPGNIIIIHDDIDIPAGAFKISKNRGAGEHNGVTSVIQALGTKDFIRIRVGIGAVPVPMVLRDYVLSRLPGDQLEQIRALSGSIQEAIRVILTEGVAEAMNRFNEKK